jgi:TRAP-type C4-dicarboxylate transport system substrate-binding protein
MLGLARKLTLALALATAAAAMAGVATPAAAQDRTVELRFSHWVPAAHPLHGGGFTEWINSIQQASNGTIRITLFPSEQLGRAADHYDMARNGIADITYVNPGYTPGRFPIIALGEIPFLVSNAKGGSQALHEWYQRYAEREMQGVRVCNVFAHDPGTFHMKREIRTPDQVRGLRIRAANGTIAQFVTSLGGTNVQVSAPESREVLERGIADGITFPWRSIMLFGIDRVVSYSMDVPLYVSDFVIAINPAALARMSPAQRAVMDAHCTPEWSRRMASGWADFEASGRTMLSERQGYHVYTLTPAELQQWRQAAAPLREHWADDVRRANAGNPDEIYDALVQALRRNDAAAN